MFGKKTDNKTPELETEQVESNETGEESLGLDALPTQTT